VSLERIRDDLMFLAGRLLHRSAQTDEERRAAEFIRQRLKTYTPDVEVDDFHCIDNYFFLFGSYFAEFGVVALLAVWWPAFAAAYGACVFLMYLAEFMGYRVLARFLPHFESQNVAARLHAPKPDNLFVVTAYYDSGCACPLSHPAVVPWLRLIHLLLLLCMVVVVATCATDALGLFSGTDYPHSVYIRWTAAAVLICAALAAFYASTQTEHVRGANSNASGAAALLRLAEHLSEAPLQNADVWLVATGSHEAWMSGVRHFLTSHKLDKAHTYILNIESVGAGDLRYCSAEGLLSPAHGDRRMREAADAVAPDYGLTPAKLRAIPSEAHVPLSRGYKTLSIIGLDQTGLPPHWNCISDRVTEVDEIKVAAAADCAEALLRRLETTLRAAAPHQAEH